MRIGVVYLGRFGAGGPVSLELARHLSGEADIFCVISSYVESLQHWRESGLPLVEIPTYNGLKQAILSIMDRRLLFGVSAQIREYSPDVLLYPMLSPWTSFLQRHLIGIPDVVVLHDPNPHPGLFPKLMSILDNVAIHRATRCVVLSKGLQVYAQRRGVEFDRLRVIPLGILSYYDSAYCWPTLEEYATRDTLLFFGRITRYKGIEVLLEAFGRLKQVFSWLKLLVVGAGDIRPYRKVLNTLTDVELVNRWVNNEEIPSFFRRARLVALPYTSASQSGVVATAAAFGVPVVTTRTGGIPEQIEHGKTGYLVDPGSVEQIVTAIAHLLRDEQYAFHIGQNLHRDFEQNRSWEKLAKAFYATCEEAVSEMRNL